MQTRRILIVEDEHALALALAATVRRSGATSDLAASAARAAHLLQQHHYDLLILDLGLPDQNGLDFLRSLPAAARPPTLIITAHGEIHHTISARKIGVSEFLTKPLDFQALQHAMTRLLPARPTRGRPAEQPESGAFIGAAGTMRPVFQQIAHSCAAADPVLIRGDTGTGKSHAARVIRDHGCSHDGPTQTLFAARTLEPDALDQAIDETRGGVLILEEVGLLSADAQTGLVRRLETGDSLPRLIATTSEDLRGRVTAAAFRSDLFYRLQILEVHLPPLRQRPTDIPALVAYFLGRLEPGRQIEITQAVLDRLHDYDWPGNLRELRNALAYALTVSPQAGRLDLSQLPDHLAHSPVAPTSRPEALDEALDAWLGLRLPETPTYRELAETLEGHLILRLLPHYDGKMARLCAALGANRTTLRQRLRKAGLDSP